MNLVSLLWRIHIWSTLWKVKRSHTLKNINTLTPWYTKRREKLKSTRDRKDWQRLPKENTSARNREHTKEEESAFTRIPVDPSRSPLWSARLTLRRASLQVGHATTHRSTLSRTLSLFGSPALRLLRLFLSLSLPFHLLLLPPPPLPPPSSSSSA